MAVYISEVKNRRVGVPLDGITLNVEENTNEDKEVKVPACVAFLIV